MNPGTPAATPLVDPDRFTPSPVGALRSARAALMDITARPDQVFLRGEGSWLWDDRGRRYLDFVQGWAVNTLGHAPACIRDALAQQASLLLTPSPALHNAPAIALYEKLGFRKIDTVKDQFRLRGKEIDDSHMCLRLGP